MKKPTKKLNFSMMEVIVVIAVVMTVASIVFSSIKASSDLAKKVTCMSNVAQIRAYTELYRKDHGLLPYSDIWLTDFSYAADYMEESNENLSIFTCPGSNDEALTNEEQLTQYTSYYYVPARAMLEANIADGAEEGFSLLNFGALASKNQLVIYDKSPDHHNGTINIAYLFGDDDPGFRPDGEITSVTSDDLLTLDSTGQLELEDADSYGSLNINPANSSNNLFTLTDIDGNVIEIRDDIESGATGQAVNITIKVKSTGRTLEIDGEEITLKTNQTYSITALSDDDSGLDPYYIYELTQDGNGQGQWWIDLFVGVGSITVEDASGNSTTITEDTVTTTTVEEDGTTTTTTKNKGQSKKND